MISLLAIGWLATASHSSQAQSVTDLLLQLELDTEKLTSMKSTLQDMYKSYELIDKGYKRISNTAKDNFNLHKLFLDGLLAITPAVQNSPHIKEILDAQYDIITQTRAATAQVQSGSLFNAQELDYIIGVYSSLLQRCLRSIEELTMTLTADQLRMSDDQRLQVINRIYNETSGQRSFLRQFNNSVAILATQKAKELNDLTTLKRLYGLPD